MLVLSRKKSEQIVVGGHIRITVVRVERNQVRLGIEAPDGIPIMRSELVSEHLIETHDRRAGATYPA